MSKRPIALKLAKSILVYKWVLAKLLKLAKHVYRHEVTAITTRPARTLDHSHRDMTGLTRRLDMSDMPYMTSI